MTSDYPFRFDSTACASCRGTCCRWGGYVWISEEELVDLAAGRGMTVEVFAGNYVRAAFGRISLQDRLVNGEHLCCLFDPVDCRCTSYNHRPQQCRSFPFWERYQEDYRELLEFCPGVIPDERFEDQ